MTPRLASLLAIAITFLVWSAAPIQAGPPSNLVQNGSFEKTTGGKPDGWEPHRWAGVETVQLARPGYKSKHCAMIASDAGANFSLMNKVAVEPSATYRLVGWIKTEGVRAIDGRGAVINIHEIPTAISTPLTGNNDWTRVEVVFQTSGQDHLSVNCCLGGWGLATGKAWFDEISLQQVNRFDLDYSYLFRHNPPGAPQIAFYGGRTAIAGQAFLGSKPQLITGKQPVRWRLICGPGGMTVDEETGVPFWRVTAEGRHHILIEARNAAGHDIAEFVLMVVRTDMPGATIAMTKYMDFILPPEGAIWFDNWRPHALLDRQFEYCRKLIGHEPTGDAKQVVQFRHDMGSAVSGNPAMIGHDFWRFDPIGGWNLGIWFHEVGHNFNAQAPVTFYSNLSGMGNPYHHHCHFLARPLFLRTVANPAAFGLEETAAENYRRWVGPTARGQVNQCDALVDWVKKGGKARTFLGDHFHLWGAVCDLLASQYGAEVLETPLRMMRTDGIPASLRDTAKTPLQVNSLIFCSMSHAANTDLRPFFDRMGYEYADEYYRSIDSQIADLVKNLPDEDDFEGWKKCPINGHYYRQTVLASNWCAAEVEARQFGGHLATVRNAREAAWLQSRYGQYASVWIGGFRNPKRHGAWAWISAEHSRMTNWDKDQPAPGQNLSFVAFSTATGKWRSVSSMGESLLGIIEADTKPEPPLRKEDYDDEECTPSASHIEGALHAVNDGIVPKKSNDLAVPRFTWWGRSGSTEWVQYKFRHPTKLSSAQVFWFDDTGTGLCRVPASWRLLYKSGGEWLPVPGASGYGVERDQFNVVTFAPIKTKALRLEAQLQPNVSSGILEWKVE